MGATTFHTAIVIVSGDATTSSATLQITEDLLVGVIALDGESLSTAETPMMTRDVYVIFAESQSVKFELIFSLPQDAISATYKVDNNSSTTMTELNHSPRTPYFNITQAMIGKGKEVRCTLAWGQKATAVTITVRPRASGSPGLDLTT